MSQIEGFEAGREARRSMRAVGAARSARHEQWLAEAMAAAYYHELHNEQTHPKPAQAPEEDVEGAEAPTDDAS